VNAICADPPSRSSSRVVHYRNALQEKPETPGLKPKFDNARTQALAQSRQQAQNCVQQRDWTCVGSEAQFILTVEPGAPDASALKAQASFYQALDILQQARTAAAQRQFGQAADHVKRAREMSNTPEVAAEASRVQMEIAAAAVAESDRLRQERKYDEAVEAMKIAVQYDPSQANRLRAVEQEREQWVAYQYEKAAYDGDLAMAKREWRAAADAYRAAMTIRAGGRADALGRYCDAMARGDAAIQNRQYDVATTAYQEAVATNQDKGEARRELDKLRIRPYDIAIRSALLVPTKPDGSPWTGPLTPTFVRLSQTLQQHINGKALERAVELAAVAPNENRPEIRVEVVLPNGSRLVSKPVTGLYATFEGNLVMATSGYDERHLLFRVMQRSANPANAEGDEIGRMDVALRHLCEQGDILMHSDSVSALRVTAKAADGRQEGTFAGLTMLQPQTGATAAATPPATGSGAPPGGGAAPPASGGVVVSGGPTSPAPPPVPAAGTVTYVPPAKPPPPATPVTIAAPPPKAPPVAPPMAPAIPKPPPGQPTHGATPVAAPPPAAGPATPPAPPPATATPPAPPATGPAAPPPPPADKAPGADDDDDDDGKGTGKGKGKGKGKGGKGKKGLRRGQDKDE
jgi:tetratricopeptide (TPR) repeat protein